jgi:putative chitinase
MTDEQLKAIMPQSTEANRQKYLPFLNKYMQEYDINTPARQAAFIAQIGHESARLRYVEEIVSGAAYEGRKDLGNTQPGDGKRFKGRGLIQITGRKNYQQISVAWGVDFVTRPELLAAPEYAVKSACWWWDSRQLNALADAGEFLKITKIINGGTNGLADRQALYSRAKEVLRHYCPVN